MSEEQNPQSALAKLIRQALETVKISLLGDLPLSHVNLMAKYGDMHLNAIVQFEESGKTKLGTADEAFSSLTSGSKCWHTYLDKQIPCSEYSGSALGWRLSINARGGYLREVNGQTVLADKPA